MDSEVRHERQVLRAFPFLPDDEKWGGTVEIVRRTTSVGDQRPRTYIDLVLRVGSRFLVLPWRGLAEIEAALLSARPIAEEHRAELLGQLARDKDARGVQRPAHGRGQPGRKRFDEE